GGQCDQGDNGSPTGPGSHANSNYDCAAELFIFSPANYLSPPAVPPLGGNGPIKYDAISSLSPVL
ncbi:MAG: hypothetical protein ACREHG_11450, partial [Candidatus Saccharimonadales bacterium]